MRLPLAISIASILACIAASPASASPFTVGKFYTSDQNKWGADPTVCPQIPLVLSDFFARFTAALEIGCATPGGSAMDFS